MNKAIKLLACAALLGSAILSGCNKNGFESSKDGAIRFSAVAKGAPSTKTVYGEDFKDADDKTWQIIDWKENDLIRVASNRAVHRNNTSQKWADYKILGSTISGHESRATLEAKQLANTPLEGSDLENGLVWDAAGAYTFWGIYPSTFTETDGTPAVEVAGISIGESGAVSATLPVSTTLSGTTSSKTVYTNADGQIITDGTAAAHTYNYTVYEPNMQYAYLTAVSSVTTKVDGEGVPVTLDFKPAFTAFEINLTSADDNTEGFSVTAVSLAAASGNSDYLAGPFTMTAGDLTTVQDKKNTDDTSAASKSVEVKSETAIAINNASGLTATLFAIPRDNTGVLTLSVTTTDGTAKLALTQKGSASPYIFKAGMKYRINLLKVGNRFTYAIELDPYVIPWIGVEKESSFSENIQARAFSFVNGPNDSYGSLEESFNWMDTEGRRLNALVGKMDDDPDHAGEGKRGSNHYEAFDTVESSFYDYETFVGKTPTEQEAYVREHVNYYELYYQQRHMLLKDRDGRNISDPHFEITFTPMAPLGGYWFLQPETIGDNAWTEGFQFKIQDGENWQTTGWNTGQIMGVPITIGIWPSPTSNPSKEYTMMLKVVFSTNKSGDPAYNADTEMQDVHSDGRYSYWKFILPVRE